MEKHPIEAIKSLVSAIFSDTIGVEMRVKAARALHHAKPAYRAAKVDGQVLFVMPLAVYLMLAYEYTTHGTEGVVPVVQEIGISEAEIKAMQKEMEKGVFFTSEDVVSMCNSWI